MMIFSVADNIMCYNIFCGSIIIYCINLLYLNSIYSSYINIERMKK